MNCEISRKFEKFLSLQAGAIHLIKESKSEFTEEVSRKELDQVLEILEPEYNLYIKKGEERFKGMLITQDKLVQTKKCPGLLTSIYYDNRKSGYEIIEAILAIQDFFDSLLAEKIPEDVKRDLQKKLEMLLSLYIVAINIVKKYIDKFHNDVEYKLTIEDLNIGLRNLQRGYDRNRKAGIVNLLRYTKKPKEKRGGFGLARGFGEFLRALPKEDEYWANEIMDAVHAIENYYREM